MPALFSHPPTTPEEQRVLDRVKGNLGKPRGRTVRGGEHGTPEKDLHITRIVVYYRPSKGSRKNKQLKIDPKHVDLLFWNEEYCDFFRAAIAATPPELRPLNFKNSELTEHHRIGSDGVERINGQVVEGPRRTGTVWGDATNGYGGSENGPACVHYVGCEWSCTHGSHGP